MVVLGCSRVIAGSRPAISPLSGAKLRRHSVCVSIDTDTKYSNHNKNNARIRNSNNNNKLNNTKRKKDQKEKQKKKKQKKKNHKKKRKHKKTKRKTNITRNKQKHIGFVAFSGVVQPTHSGRSRPIQCTTPPKGLCSAKKRLCRGCFL